MSVREGTQLLNELGTWEISGLMFFVRVLDIRTVYGRTDYRIEPVAGCGEKWVAANTVELDNPQPM